MFLRDGWWKVAARNLGGLRRPRGDNSPILDLTRGGQTRSRNATDRWTLRWESTFRRGCLSLLVPSPSNSAVVEFELRIRKYPSHGGHRSLRNFSGKKLSYLFIYTASRIFLSRDTCKNYASVKTFGRWFCTYCWRLSCFFETKKFNCYANIQVTVKIVTSFGRRCIYIFINGSFPELPLIFN